MHALECEPGWAFHQCSCYRVIPHVGKSQPTARKACVSRYNATGLATIHTEKENTFVWNLVKASGITPVSIRSVVYIGLDDVDEEGMWIWHDWSPMDYTNWEPGGRSHVMYAGVTHREPNNNKEGQDWGALFILFGTWNDLGINNLLHALGYVCEKPVLGVIDTVDIGTCPSPYEEMCDGNCYLFGESSLSWDEAQIMCAREHGTLVTMETKLEELTVLERITEALCPASFVSWGDSCYLLRQVDASKGMADDICNGQDATLVSIENPEENEFLSEWLQQSGISGVWLSATFSDFIWNISDSKQIPFTFTDWDTAQPDNMGKENCVELRHRNGTVKWNDRRCEVLRSYICEGPDDSLSYCKHNHQGRCYRYGSLENPLSYADSKVACQKRQMELLAIETQAENDFLVQIALSILPIKWGFWTSGQRSIWTWVTDEPVSYSQWATGEPVTGALCSMKSFNGSWYAQRCGSSTNSALCEKDADLTGFWTGDVISSLYAASPVEIPTLLGNISCTMINPLTMTFESTNCSELHYPICEIAPTSTQVSTTAEESTTHPTSTASVTTHDPRTAEPDVTTLLTHAAPHETTMVRCTATHDPLTTSGSTNFPIHDPCNINNASQNSCCCCTRIPPPVNQTLEEKRQFTKRLLDNLTVYDGGSMRRRQMTSAEDFRVVSNVLGTLGIIALLVTLLPLLIGDMPLVWRHFRNGAVD